MKFFACGNLIEKVLVPCIPWEYKPDQMPSEKVKQDKNERQIFYRTHNTKWNFYTSIEPANCNQRLSKDNPAKFIHAFVADYDVRIPDDRIDEAVASMSIKPQWIERSLGGNCRLVWLLSRPMAVETTDFAVWILQMARKWLSLDLLPGLDSPAFENPTRLYCNGAAWRKVLGSPDAVSEIQLQSFYVEAIKKFKFKAPEGNEIPLEVVEAAIKERFPGFSWPSAFDLDTQGPSFWIAESVSPLSAIIKAEGMLTFSAHASKPFYPWSEILGKDFVKEINEGAIAKATLDIYHDGQAYWRKIDGIYQSVNESAMKIYLKKGCGIPEKKIEDTLFHLHENARVVGAAPFVYRTPGLIEYNHRKVLNTWRNNVMRPSETYSENLWVLDFLKQLFGPIQFEWFLAWYKHFYTSGYELLPRPGQNIFILGVANRGKTFALRHVVGATVGGFVDAAKYIVQGDDFGSENYHVPLWAIDDETPGNSLSAHDRFSAMLKKAAANQEFRVNEKFRVPVTVEWAGRIGITANMDFTSSRILGSLDNSSAEKTCVYRCTTDKIDFPERYELQKRLKTELPQLCAYALAWTPPDYIARDGRYGYLPYHDAHLIDQTHQTSRAAPIKEILLEQLKDFFAQTPEATEWRGTLTQLARLLNSNPMNDFLLRGYKLEQINRFLEVLQKDGMIKCFVETGENKSRLWIFPKQ